MLNVSKIGANCLWNITNEAHQHVYGYLQKPDLIKRFTRSVLKILDLLPFFRAGVIFPHPPDDILQSSAI